MLLYDQSCPLYIYGLLFSGLCVILSCPLFCSCMICFSLSLHNPFCSLSMHSLPFPLSIHDLLWFIYIYRWDPFCPLSLHNHFALCYTEPAMICYALYSYMWSVLPLSLHNPFCFLLYRTCHALYLYMTRYALYICKIHFAHYLCMTCHALCPCMICFALCLFMTCHGLYPCMIWLAFIYAWPGMTYALPIYVWPGCYYCPCMFVCAHGLGDLCIWIAHNPTTHVIITHYFNQIKYMLFLTVAAHAFLFIPLCLVWLFSYMCLHTSAQCDCLLHVFYWVFISSRTQSWFW